MFKVILETFLGLISSITGFYVAYLYLKSLNDSGQHLLLVIALPLIGMGIWFLVQAGKSGKTVGLASESEVPHLAPDAGKFESILQKNDDLAKEWGQTVDKRDKLRVLEIAAAAEDEKN
jgi:hypothetical protein